MNPPRPVASNTGSSTTTSSTSSSSGAFGGRPVHNPTAVSESTSTSEASARAAHNLASGPAHTEPLATRPIASARTPQDNLQILCDPSQPMEIREQSAIELIEVIGAYSIGEKDLGDELLPLVDAITQNAQHADTFARSILMPVLVFVNSEISEVDFDPLFENADIDAPGDFLYDLYYTHHNEEDPPHLTLEDMRTKIKDYPEAEQRTVLRALKLVLNELPDPETTAIAATILQCPEISQSPLAPRDLPHLAADLCYEAIVDDPEESSEESQHSFAGVKAYFDHTKDPRRLAHVIAKDVEKYDNMHLRLAMLMLTHPRTHRIFGSTQTNILRTRLRHMMWQIASDTQNSIELRLTAAEGLIIHYNLILRHSSKDDPTAAADHKRAFALVARLAEAAPEIADTPRVQAIRELAAKLPHSRLRGNSHTAIKALTQPKPPSGLRASNNELSTASTSTRRRESQASDEDEQASKRPKKY